ncbi:MAG: hypothetical protein CVU19_18280 [Betaproteobacteria bacterium HGW-Betaproteobacteria-13]|uniref:Uncharacterized protein n=1 Tax=Parazoarcus communis TaxID=41977 RepID=A0A2U8H2Y9_9RHOO|nr:hypothetical protein [Parazoarcus communis]AWI80327.1 hypothetical protein CEW87_13750 [Parazoarcus communis]PKO79368.1 MAG: hypothetical protein CVU19_18280 [Betaproteobacteria bacterium HGW-Betaproteobacteria-13]
MRSLERRRYVHEEYAWLGILGTHAASHALVARKHILQLAQRRGNPEASRHIVARLQVLDPEDGVGHSVISALLDGDADEAAD